jgi:hypothetical protein
VNQPCLALQAIAYQRLLALLLLHYYSCITTLASLLPLLTAAGCRLHSKDATTVLKSLMVIHRLLRETPTKLDLYQKCQVHI